MSDWTRKEFLKTSLISAGAAALSPLRLFGAIAPKGQANGDVRIAIVGLNGKGLGHLYDFRNVPGCRIVALCDVDSVVLAKSVAELERRQIKVKAYVDFRKLLEDQTIDAVVLATPNHWHALQAIWACQAGKDVYVEKPLAHNIWEGRQVVNAARKYNRIVQAGTQSRSAVELQEAVSYIRAGELGGVQWARGLCYKLRPSIGRTTGPQKVPNNIDYNLWSGPAPLVPPRRNSPAHGTVHYDWHWFWDYGGGDMANQGVHQMDICRWMIGAEGLPPSAVSVGGHFGPRSDAETPETQIAVLNYKPAPIIFEVRGLPTRTGMRAMDAYRGIRGIGIIVQCENGYFTAGETGGGAIYDSANRKLKIFAGAGGGGHGANFIAAVKSRKQSDLNGQIEDLHVSSALCHLANISHRLGSEKPLGTIDESVENHALAKEACMRMLDHLNANEVDIPSNPSIVGPLLELAPGAERFVTREKYDTGYWANTLLTREYRRPFAVPEVV